MLIYFYTKQDKTHHYYLRYSFNGVSKTQDCIVMTSPGEENWQKIQRDLGVVLKNWDLK